MIFRFPPLRALRFPVRVVLVALVLGCGPTARLSAAAPGEIVARQDVQEGYIDVTGGRVWYRIVGVGKPGIPLLALHGGPGGTSAGFDQLEPLADERPVVVYDQLGSGLSDRPVNTEPFRVERYVEELAQVRTALGLHRVHLYGHSWGSMLALDYMLTKPAGIESLILASPLVSAKLWIQDQRAYLAAMPGDALRIVERAEASGNYDTPEYRQVDEAFARLHGNRGGPRPKRISRGEFGAEAYHFMWGPSEFSATGTLQNYERLDRLPEVRVPTLFVCGEYDEAAPATTARYQSKVLGARLVVIPDAAHAALQEQPALYRKAVRDFLHSVDSP